MTKRITRAVGALLLGLAGGAVALPTAAHAGGACPAGTGVTVVVNSSVSCDRDGGGSAASNFRDAGHSLSSYRGFVCSIDGSPDPAKACHSYAPADAYWALFWANGKGGGWTYANAGASTLNVPAGGWVAFKFQTSSARSAPGIRPYTAPPAPAPKPGSVTKPKAKQGTSGSTAAKPEAPRATPKPADSAKRSGSTKPSPSPTDLATTGAAGEPPVRDDAISVASKETGGSNATVGLGAGLAALLIAAIGAATWRRRAAGRQP